MTPGDVARLLAKCQAYDRRTVGHADIAAWHEALEDLELGPALAAVAEHYRDETTWVMPAHVRRIATRGGLPHEQPLRDTLIAIAVPFDELANRRGLAAARAAIASARANRELEGPA
jgi:hypothetical protein